MGEEACARHGLTWCAGDRPEGWSPAHGNFGAAFWACETCRPEPAIRAERGEALRKSKFQGGVVTVVQETGVRSRGCIAGVASCCRVPLVLDVTAYQSASTSLPLRTPGRSRPLGGYGRFWRASAPRVICPYGNGRRPPSPHTTRLPAPPQPARLLSRWSRGWCPKKY